MNTWGIVGLGWLGCELSKEIEKAGDQFWGTHRNNFDFARDPFPSSACDILFLNTPPVLEMTPKEFAQKIPLSSAKKIIFISSTSVYGENVGLINENDLPQPSSRNGHWLLEVENHLQSIFLDRIKILRPGGLIGGQRHPIHHLAGKSGLAGGRSQINLIHRADLVNIILVLAKTEMNTPVINAVAPYHPKKSDYYSEWADKLGLSHPLYDQSASELRQIDSLFLSTLYPNWKCPKLDFI